MNRRDMFKWLALSPLVGVAAKEAIAAPAPVPPPATPSYPIHFTNPYNDPGHQCWVSLPLESIPSHTHAVTWGGGRLVDPHHSHGMWMPNHWNVRT